MAMPMAIPMRDIFMWPVAVPCRVLAMAYA